MPLHLWCNISTCDWICTPPIGMGQILWYHIHAMIKCWIRHILTLGGGHQSIFIGIDYDSFTHYFWVPMMQWMTIPHIPDSDRDTYEIVVSNMYWWWDEDPQLSAISNDFDFHHRTMGLIHNHIMVDMVGLWLNLLRWNFITFHVFLCAWGLTDLATFP